MATRHDDTVTAERIDDDDLVVDDRKPQLLQLLRPVGAQSLTWEEKIAAIERMRERDAELKKAREANLLLRGQIQRNAGKGD